MKLVSKLSIYLLLASTFSFVGCAIVQSTKKTDYTSESGLAYYLPKGILKVFVIKEVRNNATANVSSNATEIVYTNIVVVTGQTTLTNKIPIATNQVPTPIIGTASVNSPATTNVYISTDVELVPDRNLMYLLKMKPSWLADDYMKLGVTNGLLQSLTLSNSDQTIGVINNLALTAIDAFKFVATGGFGAAGAESTFTTNVFLVDPFDADGRKKLVAELQAEFGITMDFTDFATKILTTSDAEATSGVFYRPLQAYQLRWSSSAGQGAGLLYFPNASPILSMEVKRAAFVAQTYQLNVQRGIPSEVVLNKPSQALALSMLPLNLASALVGLPTNLVQLKIDYSNKSSDLLKAQNAQITNLMALMEEQKQLIAALATNAASTKPSQPQQTVGGR